MCGIIATIGARKDINEATVGRMLDSLRQRGPDSARSQRIGPCILGQTRLSIVDIEGGVQPMSDPKLPITLTFNGEIYNFQEIREELAKKGHRFLTRSDTEVILRAYVEWGKDCVQKLDGMFAFAIWDGRSNTLFIARDRFGKKPLYYTQLDDNSFLFASEIKALFASGLVKSSLNMTALDAYLALMYVPPDQTIYTSIATLPPAHYAEISVSDLRITTKRYWSLPLQKSADTYDEAKVKVERLLKEAVRRRMIADVEVGSMLSGGIDSTLVSIEASKLTEKQLKTFSVGYGNHINELPYAKLVSDKIHSDHYVHTITESASGELRTILTYLDEPHADSSNFPQHLLSATTAQHVKVALTGDGADEFFMGYGWYWKHDHLPFIARWYEKIFSNPFDGFVKRAQIFSKKERKNLFIRQPEKSFDPVPEELRRLTVDPLTKIGLWTVGVYLPGQLLSKIDRTSMLHSLELRSPFMDTALAEYAFSLPTEYKCNSAKSTGKIILKDILSAYMPHDFVYRRKIGFGAPIQEWLKSSEFTILVDTYLKQPASRIFMYLNSAAVKNVIDLYYSGQRGAELKVWTLLCLALWIDIHHETIS